MGVSILLGWRRRSVVWDGWGRSAALMEDFLALYLKLGGFVNTKDCESQPFVCLGCLEMLLRLLISTSM